MAATIGATPQQSTEGGAGAKTHKQFGTKIFQEIVEPGSASKDCFPLVHRASCVTQHETIHGEILRTRIVKFEQLATKH